MKQIITFLRLDKSLILKDKLALYIILVPLVLSALVMAVLSAMSNSNIRITLTDDVPTEVVERISQYADVEHVDNLAELEKRVGEFDNMAGLHWENGSARVLFQGNEGEDYQSTILYMVDTAMNTSLPDFSTQNLATGIDLMTKMMMCVLMIVSVAIGGIISGLSIVTEKETLVARAYKITPLPAGRYLASRYIVAIFVGVFNLVCISLILGMAAQLPMILLATVFALPLFAWSPTLIGAISKDKMGSLSIIKVIMLVFICLPIAATVTPERFSFLYFPFPMYWHYKAIESVLDGNFNVMYGILTFLLSGSVLFILIKMFKKTLQKI